MVSENKERVVERSKIKSSKDSEDSASANESSVMPFKSKKN